MPSRLPQLKIMGTAVMTLIFIAAGVWYWNTGSHPERSEGTAGPFDTAQGGDSSAASWRTKNDALYSSPLAPLGAQNDGGGLETYRHPSLGFFFQYPKGFKAGSFADGIGETVVVEKSGDGEVGTPVGVPTSNGFQIYITPFDEQGPLTFLRVKKEIPDLVVEGPQTVELRISANADANNSESRITASSRPDLDGGRSGLTVAALVFFSQNESLGRTREAWFVYPESPVPNGNYLYQITSYASFDEELSKIMATWQFE